MRCRKPRFNVDVDGSTCEHRLSDEELPAIVFIGKSAQRGIRKDVDACLHQRGRHIIEWS